MLHKYARQNAVVVAIPRGGVVVGHEIAQQLGLVLDIVLTKKIGAPTNPEFAVGSIDSQGNAILDEQVLQQLGISPEGMEEEITRLQALLEKKYRLLRGDHPIIDIEDKTVILVDDGIATGKTMQAAIRSVRAHGASYVVLAVPVAPEPLVHELNEMVDEVQVLYTPALFASVSQFYDNFEQISDDEVRELLDSPSVV